MSYNLEENDLVYFAEEKRPYRVKCTSGRFAICTKPFNPRRTVLYTIVDTEAEIRGPDNIIFCSGYETQEDVDNRMIELLTGEIEISHRRHIPLKILKIKKGGSK